ncbi:hypothetical protein JZ751_011658, partial [Albula glossodonta]
HHSIYIGVPVPRSYRRKRRRRRSESSRDPGDGGRDHERREKGAVSKGGVEGWREGGSGEGESLHFARHSTRPTWNSKFGTWNSELEGRSVPLSPVKCGAHQNPHGTDQNMRGADCPETAFHS